MRRAFLWPPCGRCHNDKRLALRYNLPTDRIPSYANSYHGLAARGGSQSVANCASCHGGHNINVYPLDVWGTDSDDAGLHDLSQRPGLSGEVNPAAAAARIRWDGYADESQLPHRPLGNHPKLSDAGLYRVRAEISGGLVGTSSTALG
jgi:hypothetical protein